MLTFHKTCIGYSHLQSGKPCQDASYAETSDHMSIAIVSDGHGGAIHSRSDVGAQLAIFIAHGVIEEYPLTDWENPDKRQELFKKIVEIWKSLTIDHYYDNLTEQEIEQLPLFPDVKKSIRNITTLYGCTLMVACVHPNGWFVFQIGDGKCVTINPMSDKDTSALNDNSKLSIQNSTLVTEPVPNDERCFLNMTTSLCDPDAATEFRFYGGNKDNMPVAIFLGTDGIDNSWGTEEALHNFYIDILKHCHSQKEVLTALDEALPQLSKLGSSDDMSIAAIVDKSALREEIRNLIEYQLRQTTTTLEKEQEVHKALENELHEKILLWQSNPNWEEDEYIQRDRRYLEEQLSQSVDKEHSLSIRMERFQQQLKLYKLFGLDIEKEPLNDSVNKE